MCMYRSVTEIGKFLGECAIIAPLNKGTKSLNADILISIPFQKLDNISIDAVSKDMPKSVPAEILNAINPPGFPPHVLSMKKYSWVILLRNL